MLFLNFTSQLFSIDSKHSKLQLSSQTRLNMPSRTTALWCTLITAVALASPLTGRGDTSACLKTIANTFCLGGSTGEITLTPVSSEPAADPANGTVAEYQLDDRLLRVASKESRIFSISRLEQPGSWLSYTDWKKRIIRTYGQGEDATTLPPYATSRSSRRNAINSKRGRAAMIWPQDGWQLELIWDTTEHIELRYSLAIETSEAPTDSEDL